MLHEEVTRDSWLEISIFIAMNHGTNPRDALRWRGGISRMISSRFWLGVRTRNCLECFLSSEWVCQMKIRLTCVRLSFNIFFRMCVYLLLLFSLCLMQMFAIESNQNEVHHSEHGLKKGVLSRISTHQKYVPNPGDVRHKPQKIDGWGWTNYTTSCYINFMLPNLATSCSRRCQAHAYFFVRNAFLDKISQCL